MTALPVPGFDDAPLTRHWRHPLPTHHGGRWSLRTETLAFFAALFFAPAATTPSLLRWLARPGAWPTGVSVPRSWSRHCGNLSCCCQRC